MAPLVQLTPVDSKVIVVIIFIIALSISYVITSDEQDHPLRQLRLEMPKDAVMVECRLSLTSLVAVNMADNGNSHNIFYNFHERSCERKDMFSHCQATNDSVTIWAVFMNVTGTNSRTVFCNQTTAPGPHTETKSFNITLGDYSTPAPDTTDTVTEITEKATHNALESCPCSSTNTCVSSVNMLVVVAVVALTVLTSHQRLSRD